MNARNIVNLLLGPLLRVDVRQVFANSAESHEADFVELNRRQLAQGQLATGGQIAPAYAASTKKRKAKKGQPTGKVTLFDEGAFYDGMFAESTGAGVDLGSHDAKTPILVNRYTGAIFGLTVASKEQVAARLRPTFLSRFRRAVGL